MSLIDINNLSIYYEKVCALENINFQINELDFLGIIGPNGGGKTTFIKAILGLIKPKKGCINYKGEMPIGYVPQFSAFDKNFPISVMDVILIGRLNRKIKLFHKYEKKDMELADKIMKKLGIHHLKKRQISQLSGGQLQRVLIARALITQPNILILDEPTASLDTESKIEIYELLKELNKEVTIIIVSHDLNMLPMYVDKIVNINKKLDFLDSMNDTFKLTSNINSAS